MVREGVVSGCMAVRVLEVRAERAWRRVRRAAIAWCWGGGARQREWKWFV